jgi:hypothetical protein
MARDNKLGVYNWYGETELKAMRNVLREFREFEKEIHTSKVKEAITLIVFRLITLVM